MRTLQRLVLPNLALRADDAMYLRHDARVWVERAAGVVRFQDGGSVSTDTFFNGLTVGTWKRHCRVGALALQIRGRGSFLLTLGLHRRGQASVWLAEHRLALDDHDGGGPPIDITAWADIDDGMLFYELRAIGPGELRGAAFVTTAVAPNRVRLGLVITHFNRQAQVLPAIRRIRESLLDDPELADRLTLTVVDNSRNLTLAAHPRIDLIANRNLGGTGGFVRGLLSLIDSGTHSHALFMDDDASCEAASIARTLALLDYAVDPRLAIAGGLLREMAPWQLLEKGARFDGQVIPLNAGLDMRKVPDLLEAERNLERPDYGAWWFFAFPIVEVRQFPFPFFVRGDDIFFGLGNRFEIVTQNGIACLGEDFSSKHGPMTAYLDARYHLVHALLNPSGAAGGIYWVGSRLFVKALTGYLYSSARAVTLAMRHTLEGPGFFRDNLDMQAVRSEIASWQPAEKLLPLDLAKLAPRPSRNRRETFPRRLLRALTLQGFLLPGWLLRDRITVLPKAFHGKASSTFRYRRVLYEHAPSGTGFIAEFDRPRFFAELRDFLAAWTALFRRLRPLQRAYAAGVEDMASQAFWRGVYPAAPSAPVPVSAAAAKDDGRIATVRVPLAKEPT